MTRIKSASGGRLKTESSQHTRTVRSALSQRMGSKNTFTVTESNGFKIVTLQSESQAESVTKKSDSCKKVVEKIT